MAAVSTQQLALVDLAGRTKLLADSVDADVLAMPLPVKRQRRCLHPRARPSRSSGSYRAPCATWASSVASSRLPTSPPTRATRTGCRATPTRKGATDRRSGVRIRHKLGHVDHFLAARRGVKEGRPAPLGLARPCGGHPAGGRWRSVASLTAWRLPRARGRGHGTSQLLTQQAGLHLAIRGAAACRRSACWFCIARTCLPRRQSWCASGGLRPGPA